MSYNSTVVLVALLVILFVGVAYLFYRLTMANRKREEIQVRYEELEQQFNSIQLETLQSKLNPHLFKNILNSIQSHAYQTYFAMDKLSGVLDYILYESSDKFVTPKDEIEFAQNLIEINKIKISPLMELKVKMNIDESDPLYTQRFLAPLVSIDLIENAFKHADLQSPDAFVSLIFGFKKGVFTLTVSNKMSGKPAIKKEKSGIGSTAFERRLELIYQGCYKLERFMEDDLYIASLKIDLSEYKNKMLTAG